MNRSNIKFDIRRFAEKFKEVVIWMLENEHGNKIKNDLKNFRRNEMLLSENPDDLRVLRIIIEMIKSSSGRLNLPGDFDKKWNEFEKKHGHNFRTEEAKEDLIKLVGEKKRENIEKLLSYPTLKEFTEDLYKLAKERKTAVLGEKGRDSYLRDFGYWDRIPIDIHEMRFIIRSGIYHACSDLGKNDPLKKRDLQDCLRMFCEDYLHGFVVEGIDLGRAPGIVDLFIWSYSAKDRYNICAVTPKCDKCMLKRACLYALFHLQKIP